MTKLTHSRKVTEYAVNAPRYTRQFKVASAAPVFQGAMVSLDDSGHAVAASDLPNTSSVVGIALKTALQNEIVEVQTGFFAFNNSSIMANEMTVTQTNKNVYVEDDNTVSKTAGTNSVIAGTMRFIDPKNGLVVVEIGNLSI